MPKVRLITPDKKRLLWEIDALGADPYAHRLWKKAHPLSIKVLDLTPPEANIVKQEALASAIDAAAHKLTVTGKPDSADMLIVGSLRGVEILSTRLKRQGFRLPSLALELETVIKEIITPTPTLFKTRGRAISLETPKVMGILNVTPDSFSDGGRYLTLTAQEERTREIFRDGAALVDIGGVSTRPGFTPVEAKEELARVAPAVKLAVELAKEYGGFVSVDAMSFDVAKETLALGADMINDQRALADERTGRLIAESGAGVCLMYTPKSDNHQKESAFENLNRTKEACLAHIERALSFGIEKDALLIDPGFGFGKTAEQAYAALAYLEEFSSLGVPLLAGLSRKSMLESATGRAVTERSAATTAAETVALLKGAKIIRTHDVKSATDAVKIVAATQEKLNQCIDKYTPDTL